MATKTSGPEALPATVTGPQLAEILGLNRRNLQDWAAKGVLVKIGAKYDTRASVRGYIAALREQAAGRAPATGALANEKALTAAIDREIKSVKLAALKGDMLTKDEISESWSRFASQVKGAVLAIPSKARSTIPHLTAHDGETLKRICRDILTDLSKEVAAAVVGGDAKKIKDGR